MPAQQGKFWLLTIPHHLFLPFLPADACYIRGQLESGSTTGYLHWQVLVAFKKRVTLSVVKRVFGDGIHAEYAKSQAARDYVWKDDTAVAGTRFELGDLPVRRNNPTDWATVRSRASAGDLESIPDDIYVRHYGNLRRIAADHCRPTFRHDVRARVFWGPTATGKSRTAWAELGELAYAKDPRTKWWCGYKDQRAVVVDEFRGDVAIGHLLRWLDRYPCLVETKGSATPLMADNFIFTSNLHPKDWYPDLDEDTKQALMRRLEITHFLTLQ